MKNYNYYQSGNLEPKNLEIVLKTLKEEKIIISTEHFRLMEAAQNHELPAMCELSSAFTFGNICGIPKNYRLARYYTDNVMNYLIQTKDVAREVESYKNSGIIEAYFGNYNNAKIEFLKAMQIMCKRIDPAEWHYDIQDYIKELSLNENG